MMKKTFLKSLTVLTTSFMLLLTGSCSVGLGEAVDTDAPTIDISYPPKNAIIRESFIASGLCDDDIGLDYIEVTVTNTETRQLYGPYEATLSEDEDSWSIELNQRSEGEFDVYNSYMQWEYPDGYYIISAVAYDKSGRVSQETSLPVSIDNTAPVLLVSKPLAVGTENASTYGRNLNIIGDISEEHETTKLTLNYKEFNENANSFVDSEVRTLEISGFGTMSSDNPLTIAKFDESTAESASSILTNNYRTIYGQAVDVRQSNQKNYYCGFLLEDNARVYRTSGDSGVEPGNQTTQYYILSDVYNEALFSDSTYSLNARNLMLLLNGQSSYSGEQISSIVNILKETGNSASSTELEADKSSKFSIDPKNNPLWSITNFNFHDGTFGEYDLGAAIPLVLKVGGDGIEIDKSSLAVELYHLGYDETPGEITADTPHLTLIRKGEYTEDLLRERVNQPDALLAFTSTDIGIKINHFYEFVVTGNDVSGNSIESENGLRFGFKRKSTYTDPRFIFTSDSESFEENAFYSGAQINNSGITIKGSIITGHEEVEIESPEKISISGISITDTSDSSRAVLASDSDNSAEVKYRYEITNLIKTFDGDEANGKTYSFTARIYPKDNTSVLAPLTPSAYKYKVGFIAEDSLHAKNEVNEFEFKVDNKNPELPLSDIVITPVVNQNGTNYVNGIVIVSGSVSDTGSGFNNLKWKINDGAETTVSDAGSTWRFSVDTTQYPDNTSPSITFIVTDNVGNTSTATYPININQATDNPVIKFTNNIDAEGKDVIFTNNNKVLVGSVTDDDGLAAVAATLDGTAVDAGTVTAGSTSHGLKITLPETEGEYDISVTATDSPTRHLNSSTSPAAKNTVSNVRVKVDNGAPELTITSSNNSTAATYYQNAQTVTGAVKDGSGVVTITRVIKKIENGSETPVGEPAVITAGTGTADEIKAQIIAGTAAWTDNADSINQIVNQSGTYKIVYTAKDKYAAEYDVEGAPKTHTTSKEIIYSIDKERPVISSVKLDGNAITGWINKNSGTFTVETGDGLIGSGVVSVAYTTTDPAASTTDPEAAAPVWVNLSETENGWESFIAFEASSTTKHLWFQATDRAGNKSEIEHVQLQMDVNPPTLTASGISGNKYVNKQSPVEFTVNFYDGSNESGIPALNQNPLKIKIGDTELPPQAFIVSPAATENNYNVSIAEVSLASGALTITGTDVATNKTELVLCTLIVDVKAPDINSLTLTMENETPVYKKAADETNATDTYYINRNPNKNSKLTISGTATDDYLFEKIELLIAGQGLTTPISLNSTSSTWQFDNLDLRTAQTSSSVTLIVYDKAGNIKEECFDIKYDEAKPSYRSLKSGTGGYNEKRYGKLTAIDFATTYRDSDSGLAKLEYRLYDADKTEAYIEANLGSSYTEDQLTAQLTALATLLKNTNNFDSIQDPLGSWSASGSFAIDEVNTGIDRNATASISGFKQTKGRKTNYLLLRPVDNCGNKGDVKLCSINVDQTAPTVVASSTEKLTNGTTPIYLNGAVYDNDSGLKALRVYVNGTLAIDGNFTKKPANGLTVVAKKADDTLLNNTSGSNNAAYYQSAVEVSFTNQYGTLTYIGYKDETQTEKCSLKDAAAYATWTLTLTPNSGTWFTNLPENTEHHVIAIAAEDWADEWKDYKGEGNIPSNPARIALLKKDTRPPRVESISPSNGARINGENTITGTTSDEGSVPAEVSLYFAPVTSETAPAEISGYTRLRTKTTEEEPSSPDSLTDYEVLISELYNYSFTQNFFDERFISADSEETSKDVWILVHVKDAAGNESVLNPVKYTIDRNQDRPTISFTDISLAGVTSENPLIIKSSSTDIPSVPVSISISDDDGVVTSAKYRTVTESETGAWTDISLTGGSGSFNLSTDGRKNIEFKIVDRKGAEFSSTGEITGGGTRDWKRIYIKDSAATPNTFEGVLPVILDTHEPVVTLTHVGTTPAADFSAKLGGKTKNILLTFTATDNGSGINEAEVNAIVKLGENPIQDSPFTATKIGTGTYTVTIPCNAGSGSVTVTLFAKDKAGFEGTTERQFEQDNTPAAITVNTPPSDKDQSGTPAATGSITEGVRLSYAVSPIIASPKTYTAETAFSYSKKNSDTGVTETQVLSSEGLAEVCSYTAYNEPDTEVSTFNIPLNLNAWLVAMGITTNEALNAATDPFDDIVRLYLHLKAEDSVGNESETQHEIWVDPQGDRPKVYFSYPAGDNPTLGGAINIIGSVEGKTSSYTVTMQLLDSDDTELRSYTIPVDGTVWRQKINESGELDPTEAGQKRVIKIRLTAEDSEGRTSSVKTKTINIDNDIPVVNQNIQLVKWNDGYNAGNGLALTASGSAQLEADGSVKFASGAVKARRAYSEGMSIAGKWYVVGYVTDYSGISEVRTGGASGTLLSGSLNSDEAIIIPYKVNNGEEVTNYVFSFPAGSAVNDAVGVSEVTVFAKDNGTGDKAKSVTKLFRLNYDNKKPLVIDLQNGLKVMNDNGYYTFGSEAFEETIGGANQSGVERIAFYFTRNLNGQNVALNTMIRSGRIGNQMPVSDFTRAEGLLWQSVAVSSVNESVITVGSVPAYAHKGGIVKVNETIYKITNISGTHVTLSGAPGNASEAFFTFAGVIDSEITEDIPVDALKITDDYGYGFPISSHDIDGDLIPESCLKSGTKCTWEASVNSKNMSDGPVILNYVVFDKAGNYHEHSANGIVQNNSPRLAGAYIGTDENGNNTVDENEFVSYHQLYAGGYNGVRKITELTLPVGATAAEPASAIKIKRKTVIKPEIVGGNGKVGYTYTVSRRNSAGTAWEDSYYYTGNIPKDLGMGTGDSEDIVDLYTNENGIGIVLTVDDILNNSIRDENYQKFAFTIWDSTQGLTYGLDTQSAVLNVIMDVALNDVTPATNKIIPFYWKGSDENSLKDNSKEKGHIELSKDLPSEITSKAPKASGAFKLEGIAQDNSLLKSLSVKIKGTEYPLASYADGVWTTNNGTGWSAEIKQATYAELRAAGYITVNPLGKRDKDNVPYASQDYGHVVHWVMNIDTEVMGITPEEGIGISVSALDKGTPYTASGAVNRNAAGALVYTLNDFANNGDGVLPELSGGNDGEQPYTSSYTIDVVPYITIIKTKLSEKSKKTDSTEFDRTALGHYPVAVGETITMSGFNLAGGTVKFTSADGSPAEVAYNASGFVIPSNAKSGKVSIVVDDVESYNNRNNNNSQGSYGAALPAASAYGEKRTYNTFTNFYNRRPNTANNYILTDDVEFDVWQINSRAAKPYATGVISDPIMKINPNNSIIGFAYQSGERRFSMGHGNTNSYQGYLGDYDNLSATGFVYDSEGNSYGLALGGDINGTNSVAKFAFMTSLWGSSGMDDDKNKLGGKHQRFEQIGQIGKKADRSLNGGNTTDSAGQYIDKSRALSPSIAVSGSGTNATIYLAYYDHFNQEIRFRWATKPKTGARGFDGKTLTIADTSETLTNDNKVIGNYIDDNYGQKELGSNSKLKDGNGKYWSIDKYNIINFQIIAEEKSYTYEETTNGSSNKDDNYKSVGVEQTSPALGISGPYVDIAVLPANSAGNSNSYDVVVMVWYDSKNNKLKYTYNTVDLASIPRNLFEGSAHTQEHWHAAKTIFSHAGYYCNIEVDGTGGIHIAAYDNDAGDICYAQLSSFDAAYTESTMSCTVDSNGMVGSNLTLDVAYDKSVAEGGIAIPYISYYGSIGPKLAYLTSEGAAQTNMAAGALKDKFTGFWEITEIPTTSNAPKDRVNVALWKDSGGIVKASTSTKTALVPAGTNTTAANAVTIGNGTTNPVVGYEIRPTSAEGYMETAQKK